MAVPSREDLDQLSIPERVQLIEKLWESISESTADFPLTDVQRAELDRRITAHEADPSATESWDAVQARLERKA